jgi:pimeloyl-ACP methyl ester carboxylesterase
MAVKSIIWDDKKFDISYEIINPKNEKTILFLHGWGSNKEIMKQAFVSKFKEFRHIYVDMPGFGKSENIYVLHTTDYANIMQNFLDELHITPSIIAGHSFGGKVSTLLNPKKLSTIK